MPLEGISIQAVSYLSATLQPSSLFERSELRRVQADKLSEIEGVRGVLFCGYYFGQAK